MSRRNPEVPSKLKKHLINIGEYEKFKKIFSMKDRPFKEKFSEIWGREDLRSIIKPVHPDNPYNRKDDRLAKDFVTNALRFFRDKKYENALLSLNFALLSGQNPKSEFCSDLREEEIQPLQKAYDIRSALLNKMGKYQECIRDIDKVIEMGCPSKRECVLQQRKVDSLLQLKKNKEAERNVKSLLEKANASKDQKAIDELQELLKKCRIKETGNQEDPKEELPRKIDIFERGLEYPLFIKKYRKDKDINVVSDSVKIHFSPERGRHLIASKDIEPGEILLAERSLSAAILSKDKLRSYCCVCFRKTVIILPCDTCSLVCYCSEDCITTKRNIHPIECPVLMLLLETNVDEEVAVVFRGLLKLNMQEILSEVMKTENVRSPSESGLKEARSFFNSSVSYSTLTKLEGHLDKRSGESVLESVANAVLVVKLLQMIPKFWEGNVPNEAIEQSTENLEILGGEVIKLIFKCQCNIHLIKELSIDRKQNVISIVNSDVGYGIYKNFSMMNHSCCPNTLHSNWGDVKYLYSVSFIPKGGEILDTYGERFVSHEITSRKATLKKMYHFECECEACVNNWPLFDEITECHKWICPACKTMINQITFQCENCEKGSNNDSTSDELKTSETYDVKTLKEDFRTAFVNYMTVHNDIQAYKPSLENIKKISVYLSLLSKYTIKPNKPIHEAEETMMRAYDFLGSFSYKELSFLK